MRSYHISHVYPTWVEALQLKVNLIRMQIAPLSMGSDFPRREWVQVINDLRQLRVLAQEMTELDEVFMIKSDCTQNHLMEFFPVVRNLDELIPTLRQHHFGVTNAAEMQASLPDIKFVLNQVQKLIN